MNHPLPNTFESSCQRMAGIALLLLLGLAQPAWAALVVNAGNGTVTDSTTSLVWDQCPHGLSGATCTTGTALVRTWSQALDVSVAANTANYKGFSDWRVPNKNELESITKIDSHTAGQPVIDTTAFPNTPITGDAFGAGGTWTSTTFAPVPSTAWVFLFFNGSSGAASKTNTLYVRLVRSGQSFASFDLFAVASADLSITKTDGVTAAVPGGSVTYTITASNAGPSAVAGATVADTFPASLTATWTCVGAAGGTCAASGSGNINDSTVNLPVGASAIYTVSATVSPAATGTLSNSATVSSATIDDVFLSTAAHLASNATAVSSATIDPNPANNNATDTDTLTPQADLSLTKTDGVTTVVPGGSVTYTITASNAGPSNAPGSTVADTLPATLTGATWTCVGAAGGTCTASGSGNINDTVNLPAGGSVTYTLAATVSGTASGTLSNTATVTAGAGITDPTPGNNSATDSDTVAVAATADLAITVTDAPDPVTAGSNLTYTVTVSNSGPGAAASAQWNDTLPASTTFVSLSAASGWACTTPAVGASGVVSCSRASVPAGSGVFSLVVGVASATAPGTVLSNTITVTSATTDPTPGNNSMTTSTTVRATVVAIPTMSEWGLMLLAGLLAVLGVGQVRRREGRGG